MTTQTTQQYQLVWLRRDQRTQDNKALYHARQKGPVVCIWLTFTEQWREHHDSPNKLYLWQENIKNLANDLAQLHIPLITRNLKRFHDASNALLEVITEIKAEALWLNDEYGVNEQRRDEQVCTYLQEHHIPSHRFTDDCLAQPGSLLNKQGGPFKVFTPFRKALYATLTTHDVKPLPAPKAQEKQSLSLRSDPWLDIKPSATQTEHWLIGEQQAHQALHDFLQHHADNYKALRDFPAEEATSRLSTALTAGTLSIRQCFYSAWQANQGELDTGSKGLACWLSELAWREFYRHILVCFPRVSMGKAFQVETDQLTWSYDQNHLEAWQKGHTGVPIVDAAMRQLVATGWMHNRLRMVVAMYLSKDLRLDWRLGEQFFMEHLIDGDLASNNGGWQWAASTGTDAAPYFRMFNPVSQSEKFDAEGIFIRTWLPELNDLDNKTIHAPAANGSLFYDATIYPYPIVDHGDARKATLEAFKRLKKSPEA